MAIRAAEMLTHLKIEIDKYGDKVCDLIVTLSVWPVFVILKADSL